MSTVTDTQAPPVQYAPKAGNTVETLTPKAVVPNAPETVPTPATAAPKETPKAAAPVSNKVEATISRKEFQELADEVQHLAERIKRYNAIAAFKIPE